MGRKFTFIIVLNLVLATVWGQNRNHEIRIPGTGASIEMVMIPGGSVLLGPQGEGVAAFMDTFWMSRVEITYEQYQPFRDPEFDRDTSLLREDYTVDAITRPTVPYLDFTHSMGGKGGYPAVSMTQQAALRYCQWLYEKTGIFFRLPTEAEWEYACLGGEDPMSVGTGDDYAWHWDNSGERYHVTGQKKPNGYGLYDMQGNVSEYTAEQYTEDYYAVFDPLKPHEVQFLPSGKYGRSVRGGAYDDNPEDCSCHTRIPSKSAWQARDPQIPKSLWWNPDSPFVGFRVVKPKGKFSEADIKAYFEHVIVD